MKVELKNESEILQGLDDESLIIMLSNDKTLEIEEEIVGSVQASDLGDDKTALSKEGTQEGVIKKIKRLDLTQQQRNFLEAMARTGRE